MKKFLLLSGVAMLFATQSEAMQWNRNIVDPYMGVDYVYSRAHHGGLAKGAKENYNSPKFNLGMEMYRNWSMEFSYQMSPRLKSYAEAADRHIKNSFQAYALDMYGKYPIMCSNVGALATIGTAIYNARFRGLPDKSFTRVGYRIGAGLQYDFATHFAARVVGRYSYVGSERLNNLKEVTVGMLYRF
ncbi:MAG: porin family protein [Alphaproteobacteria bacterium]|nr:porin family protein [Alphaproteobacteria bacterium]